jgi:hypothetical protein
LGVESLTLAVSWYTQAKAATSRRTPSSLATFVTFAFQAFHLPCALRLGGWRTLVKHSSLIPVERIEKAI